jgi:hypothetical protein
MTTSQQHFIPTNGMYHEVSKLIGEIGRITHIRERAIASVSNAGRSRASFTNNGELSMMPYHVMLFIQINDRDRYVNQSLLAWK